MIDIQLKRLNLLVEQRKYTEADKLVVELLQQDPNNLQLLIMASEVALELDQLKKAERLINTALSLAPDEDSIHYVKAKVLICQKKYNDAENALKQATTINPEEADYFALWSSVKLSIKKFNEALEMANKALELDSENILGLNMRSTALLKLNAKEESFQTIDTALKEDPNNAYTHSNYGWNLLEKGDHKKALEHFGEALKHDPNMELAQAGMAEALKARYVVYRAFLKYSFWMSNMTSKYQWGVIIGFYVAFKFLKTLAKNNETLQPYLVPVLVLLGIVAFSTWVLNPVSNLFLRLNSYGKYLLDKKEIRSANFVGGSMLVFFIGLLMYLITSSDPWIGVTAFGFAMMIPLGVMFAPGKYRYALPGYALVMGIVGVIAIAISFSNGALFNGFTALFIFGLVAFQWIANFLIIQD